MTKPKVIIKNYKYNLNQTTAPKVEMVILNSKYETLHKPVYCKDYFNEFIATELDGKSRTQYGFISKRTNEFFVADTFKLALISRPIEYNKENFLTIDYLADIIQVLNTAENNRGYIPTYIEATEDDDIVVLNSDIRWADKPVYFSLYTLLIRVAMGYNNHESLENYINNYVNTGITCNYNDKYILRPCTAFVNYLINGGTVNQSWNDYPETRDLHNNSGINSYFKKFSYNIDKIIEDVSKKEAVQVDEV